MTCARAQHGLSLVEVTIIVLTLMLLGGVLAPSILDYVDDARWVKVKEDCEAIGLSVARLTRDVGPCLKMDGRLPCNIYNRVDMLISEGSDVEGYAGWGQMAYGASSGGSTTASSTTTTSSSGGSSGGVNYVTEYVPRPVPAGTVWRDATRLGGSTAFYTELVTAASLKRMIEFQGLADDIRTVLRDSGIPGAADGVIATLRAQSTTTTPTASLESCSQVEPPVGTVVECQLAVGDTLHWMAYRPGARSGNRAPARLEYVRWAGKEPVRSFAFRVATDKEIFSFLIPAPCANLSLVSVTDIRQRAVPFEGTAVARETTTTTSRSASSSYGASRSSSAGVGWGQNVWANARGPIGWYHTPMWAGTPNGHPNVDFIENHLIRNWPSGSARYRYAVPGQLDSLVGPRFNLGWRGAYLSGPIGNDPWGHKYFVNTIFLFAYGNQPQYEGYSHWVSDTFCLSAGPNGWVETPFASYGEGGAWYGAGLGAGPAFGYSGGMVSGGDDFVYVIAGGSR